MVCEGNGMLYEGNGMVCVTFLMKNHLSFKPRIDEATVPMNRPDRLTKRFLSMGVNSVKP